MVIMTVTMMDVYSNDGDGNENSDDTMTRVIAGTTGMIMMTAGDKNNK